MADFPQERRRGGGRGGFRGGRGGSRGGRRGYHGTPNYSTTEVFVGGPGPEAQADVQKHFSKHGTISAIRALGENGFSLTFASEQAASNAIASENGANLNGTSLRVEAKRLPPTPQEPRPANPTAVFVGGIDQSITQDDVGQLFSKYGNVTDVNLKGQFGFVTYDNADSAAKAVQALGTTSSLKGFPIRVEQSGGAAKPKKAADGKRVYIRGLPTGISREAVLAAFPGAVEASLNAQFSYGHVSFDTDDNAKRAIARNGQNFFGSSTLTIEPSR